MSCQVQHLRPQSRTLTESLDSTALTNIKVIILLFAIQPWIIKGNRGREEEEKKSYIQKTYSALEGL